MGYFIKERREEKGMTQDELSAQSGVSRVAISMIENGKIVNVSSLTLLKLADALGTTCDDLLFGETVKST